jgi:hypothetical protein
MSQKQTTMKNLLFTVTMLLITTIVFSQKSMVLLPNADNYYNTNTFYGTGDKCTVSFDYAKLAKNPAALQMIVANVKDMTIVYYMKIEFHRDGKILFTFDCDKGVPYVITFLYAVGDDFNNNYNTLFINRLKIK